MANAFDEKEHGKKEKPVLKLVYENIELEVTDEEVRLYIAGNEVYLGVNPPYPPPKP